MSYIKPLIASLIVAPMIGLTSCSNNNDSDTVKSRKQVLGELMDNKPIRQFENVMAGFEGYGDSFMKESKIQSALDSVAYGDIFKKSKLGKDADAKAEFRAIAEQTRPEVLYGDYDAVSNALDEKIKDLKISKKAYEANEKEYSKMTKTVSNLIGENKKAPLYDKIIATKQFKADSVAYRKFFKRHDLLQDVAEELAAVAKKVRP